MKKKITFVYKVLLILGILLLLLFVLMLKPVAEKVAGVTGKTSDYIRETAQTAAGIVLGVVLVTWGIAALSIPILGGVMIIAGLAMLAWNVYPLFTDPDPTKVKAE